MTDFAHLHVHTEFSLLDGLSKIPKLVSQAKLYGQKHLALTDHGGLYGAIKFYKTCKEENINPIIGCEMYLAKRALKDKQAGHDQQYYHLTVLAKNFEGYQNLIKLVTISHLDGFYYRPRVDTKVLQEHSGGLMALSGCNSSEISRAIVEENFKLAKEKAKQYINIFGEDNFFLEVQKHQFADFRTAHTPGTDVYEELDRMAKEEEKILSGTKKLAKETGLMTVATNDLHYILPGDATAQDAIVCIQTGKTIAETKRLRMIDSPTYYLKTGDEMMELFLDMPEAVTNSVKVAQKANIEIPLGNYSFPRFEVPKETTPNEFLKAKTYKGIKTKVPKVTEEIKKRLDYELSVISKKGYSTYFLVVADFVNWSRSQGIVTTTRGSASGSLVSYAIGITNVNPLYFKLPFERFLNLYRPSLPDIDVDLADNKRDSVISYVREKYGHDKVAQIGTFGTMMARGAVRDVARVLGWPYSKADKIAKMIPMGAQGFPMSIELAKRQNRDLGNMYEQDTEVKELLDLAQKIEGNARHVSIHAAGVVIAPTALTDFVPLQKENTGEKIITQYEMHDVEEVGLVKMDFLGIRNLSILGASVDIVKMTTGKEINLNTIPFDDKKAFEILAKGETMGLFQLGGTGMTRYLKELKPTSIFDIMAMISLFRPGPMNSIPEFIERKNNSKKVQYYDPRMEEYLKESYGVIVYQDDVLLTAINIAGYNWEEADKFRKAMGKKIPAEMAKQKEKFIEGTINNGMTQEKAEGLFKLIEPFAAYGFNKAHAASYAVIAYQTAFMKANYPVEFMTAVMTAESEDADKIAAAVNECAKMKILVLPPDINASKTGFSIEKTGSIRGIRFGLSAIKNVGRAAIDAVLTERDKKGSFKSLDDFARRVNLRVVNRKTLESLIKAGAMDQFGKRSAMLKVLDEVKNSGSSLSKTIAQGQGSLFDEKELEAANNKSSMFSIDLHNASEAPKEEILSWERQLLGFYLTEHPLAKYEKQLSQITSGTITEIDPINLETRKVKIGGIIAQIRTTFTKIRQEEMCFLKIQDTTGTIEVIVFPKVFSVSKHLLSPDQIVIITGKLESDEQSRTIIAESIASINDLGATNTMDEYVEIEIPKDADRILLSKIYEILKENKGNIPAYLSLLSANGQNRKIPVPFGVRVDENLRKSLENLGCQLV